MYAELAIYQAPVRTTFHYAIPDELSVQPGHLVEVHFRTGLSQGIVLTTGSESPVAHTKPILTMLLSDPVLTPAQIALGRWMADYYHAPLGACLWLMLPPGVARRGGTLYTLVGVSEALNAGAAAVVALLKERGALRAAQLDKALPGVNWRDALRPLLARGQITAVPISPTPDAKAQKVKTVSLNLSAEDAAEIMGRLLKHPKQAAVLNALLERGESLWLSDLAEHTGASYDSIRRLAAKGWITIREEEHLRDPLAGRFYAETVHPPLTPTQAACWEVIRAAMDARSGQTFLLHGVTGSGKTEIYLRAIERALEQGRGAIVLVPEIALVAPTVGRFAGRFPGQTAIVHSSLTEGEQYDTWRRARAGEVRIIIGARSALFTPLPDVGVVIVDEEHDDSYKQSPPLPPPYYHAREVAAALVRETGGVLILGSATPDITTTFRARRGDMTYLTLPQRVVVQGGVTVADAPLPAVQVVDMRRELREGNRGMFSRDLRAALLTVLERDEQAILFLNRRGQATFIMCRDCGYVARCPECDIPLTYHTAHKSGEDRLVCHYCGHTSAPPQTCPQCRSERIRYLGAGTANVAQTVGEEFPAARVIRWDRDTAANRADHESIFERFASGEGNVLVGTQMIVKGLDLPRVTLVGAMLADTSLGLPDYRAGERAFQLLTQAAGRAGRGAAGGRVIFQTYQPDHYAIRAAAGHDYSMFYDQEIAYRGALIYPPYKRLVRFLFKSAQAGVAPREADLAAKLLQEQIARANLTATTLIGPTPAFFGKIDGVYQWHIIARTTDPARLLDGFTARSGWLIDIDPVDML